MFCRFSSRNLRVTWPSHWKKGTAAQCLHQDGVRLRSGCAQAELSELSSTVQVIDSDHVGTIPHVTIDVARTRWEFKSGRSWFPRFNSLPIRLTIAPAKEKAEEFRQRVVAGGDQPC